MDIIKRFFVEEDLEDILGWLGIDYKKSMNNRIILSCFFTCFTIFIGIYFKSIYILIFSIFVGIGYYKYQYFSVKKKKKKEIALKRRMFPSFVKKMLILIRTNNQIILSNVISVLDPQKGVYKSYAYKTDANLCSVSYFQQSK